MMPRPIKLPPVVSQPVAEEAIQAGQISFTTPDGAQRVCWPTIVEYEGYDGKRHALPPPGRYKVVVHDLERYDHLCATGAIYSPAHRGAKGVMIDNRKTGSG